jgi:hypothetical protein
MDSKKVEATKITDAAEKVADAKVVVKKAKVAEGLLTKERYKEYLYSMALTFVAGFSAELLVHINEITPESLENGAIWALLFVAVRTGLKLVLEGVVLFLKPKI